MPLEATAAKAPPLVPDNAIRVMVVDDSAVIRGLITSMLEADKNIKVVASCTNGQIALQTLNRADPDVVILDIEMPVMDGITALPKLLEARPNTQIIIASTLSQRNAEISLHALNLGAADYVPKPSTARLNSSDDFRRELLAKVKLFGGRAQARRARSGAQPAVARPQAAPPSREAAPISLRKPGMLRPQILLIGSSTGGPQALNALLKDVPLSINVPIVITQHMPPTFTSILAQHVAKSSGWPCLEAKNGEPVVPGKIYVAPGDHHLTFAPGQPAPIVRLTDDPPENFCRPAVDPMFRSAARLFGSRILALVLTGMGSDGMKGGQELVAAGGTLIAQDEASSVVWGMPGAVAGAGICSAVLPLNQIAAYVNKSFATGAG